MPKFILLWTDIFLFICLFFSIYFIYRGYRSPIIRVKLDALWQKPLVIVTGLIFLFYLLVACLDSIHMQQFNHKTQHYGQVESIFDMVFAKRSRHTETTYSSPFSSHSFVKEMTDSGESVYPYLQYVKKDFSVDTSKGQDIVTTLGKSLLFALLVVGLAGIVYWFVVWRCKPSHIALSASFIAFWITLFALVYCVMASYFLSQDYHILGTGKIGQDVFYFGLKSIRTSLIIGLLTTLFMLPFALFLGTLAGLSGGKVDDVIQYIYITLSSIPGVLLIAASILSLQVFISNHTEWFPTLIERSDARLLSLCFILGVTSWTSLCRMLRAETLKLRELEYVQAAEALGASKIRILINHILPNVMHLVVIAVVLDFSFLVLAEAVLSYIGVGVSPLTISWGNMINSARLELAREPLVWWPMLCAFGFMFILVLSVNLLSDAVRDVFDPKSARL